MTNEFKDEPQYRNSVTSTLPVETDTTSELIRAALRGLRTIYRDGYRDKKAGVMCTALIPASQVQPDFFDRQDRPRSKHLMAELDAVNDRWGSGTLDYASSGLTKAWKIQFHRRSPAHPTNWNELPVTHA
jgi:DNA polymerase V